MSRSPPLRFLVVVLGGWAAMRAALLAPVWPPPATGAAPAAAHAPPLPQAVAAEAPAPPQFDPRRVSAAVKARTPVEARQPSRTRAEIAAPVLAAASPAWPVVERREATASPPPFVPPLLTLAESASTGRWSLSLWVFGRRGETAALVEAGRLGGSQAGARLSYRLNRDPKRPLALSARLAAPLRRAAGAEAALGLDWRPSRRLPIHLLLERRQALGGEGRSAFGLTAYAGIGDVRLGRFRIDAYAQAGIVGVRSRDRFGDGALRFSLPLGKSARLGAGAWGAAQPGLSRLDLGPQAALRLPIAGRSATLAADWRLRVAGKAEPGSGPTLTMSTAF